MMLLLLLTLISEILNTHRSNFSSVIEWQRYGGNKEKYKQCSVGVLWHVYIWNWAMTFVLKERIIGCNWKDKDEEEEIEKKRKRKRKEKRERKKRKGKQITRKNNNKRTKKALRS